MVAAVIWNLVCWWTTIPSSSTHALIGGLVGATLIIDGPKAILASGLFRIILPLMVAPIIGLVLGFILMGLLLIALRNATPRINSLLRNLQVGTAVLLGMSNSANDSHKSMGIIVLGLILAGQMTTFAIPFWVLVACPAALALGASRGDWRQIRNLGSKVYRIRPLNTLASQITSTAVVLAASALGVPVSTSHIISTALMGSGASEQREQSTLACGGRNGNGMDTDHTRHHDGLGADLPGHKWTAPTGLEFQQHILGSRFALGRLPTRRRFGGTQACFSTSESDMEQSHANPANAGRRAR